MPELEDFAALPTSWALTLWDALPLFLSIEVALGVALIAAFGRMMRDRLWRLTAVYPLSGIAYLSLFDTQLAVIMAVVAAAALALNAKYRTVEPDAPAPEHPLTALRIRGGAVLGDVAIASAVAAVIKIFLTPEIAPGSPYWLAVGLLAGQLMPGSLGVAAIPALAVGSAADGLPAAAVTLIAASVRPLVWERLRQARFLTRDADVIRSR